MYLNLDLLYNTYIYLFPLFYYSKENYGYYEVYSPMTFKSVFVNVNYNWFILYDYKNSRTSCREKVIMKFYMQNCTFTENIFYYEKKVYMEKCKPFKLNPENLHFLKSNTRINK